MIEVTTRYGEKQQPTTELFIPREQHEFQHRLQQLGITSNWHGVGWIAVLTPEQTTATASARSPHGLIDALAEINKA